MNPNIKRIQEKIEPLRQEIINHKLYSSIETLDDLRIFMEYHVYAVWDFMSLLKSLQNQLTCTSLPWLPVGDAETRFLINEIVAGEESDVDANGIRKSHFEMYLDAMVQCGADCSKIAHFIKQLQDKKEIHDVLNGAGIPQEASEFMKFTFGVIESNKAHLQAAVFTFGREDLIPGMFLSIVRDIDAKFPERISDFKYYLERHIEVDGDHHSHLALQMTAHLCGDDANKWLEAEEISINALKNRIALWDGAHQQIIKKAALV